MQWVSLVLAVAAIIAFGIYAYTAMVKALGIGLCLVVIAWCVQLIVTRGHLSFH